MGDIMSKKIRFGKRFMASLIAVSLIGGSAISLKLYRTHEVNRVKGYLEDFLNEDNYVDLSKVPSSYDIADFKGKYLYEALKGSDISYVIINGSYIYDLPHVYGFIEKNAVDYSHVLGTDQNGDVIYDMYKPIAVPTENGVTYSAPPNYELEDVCILAEPIRYEELIGRDIKVTANDYEPSYSLHLTNGKNR